MGRRKIEIVLEKHSLVRVYACPTARCQRCRLEVTMVTPESAARIANVTVREVYRSVETNRVHFIEIADGSVRICLDSVVVRRSTAPE